MADSLAKPCKYQHLNIEKLHLSHISSEVLNSIIPEAVPPGHRGGRGRGIYLKDLVWGYELYQKIDWEKSLTVSCKGIAVELDSLDSFPTRLFQVVVIPGQLNESQDDTWSWLELNLCLCWKCILRPEECQCMSHEIRCVLVQTKFLKQATIRLWCQQPL